MKVETTLLLVLSLASVAHAQEPSAAERAYADGLVSTLGPTTRVERVAFRWTPNMDGPGVADSLSQLEDGPEGADAMRVRGLRVDAERVVVRRFRFEDAAAAELFAARSELGTLAPVVGELRGAQVIFVTGEPVRDAAFARRALDAAWRGLPCSVAASEATFANLGGVDLVLSTTRAGGPLARAIQDAHGSVRQAQARGTRGVEIADLGPVDGLHARLTSGASAGLNSRTNVTPDCTWMWASTTDERAAPMGRYFAALTRGQILTTTSVTETVGVIDILGRTANQSSRECSIEMAGPGDLDPNPTTDALLQAASDATNAAINRTMRSAAVPDRPLGQ